MSSPPIALNDVWNGRTGREPQFVYHVRAPAVQSRFEALLDPAELLARLSRQSLPVLVRVHRAFEHDLSLGREFP